MDFTSARCKKQKLDGIIDGCDSPKDVQKSKEDTRSTKFNEELAFNNLSINQSKHAVLSVVPEHSDAFVPKTSLSTFPQPIASLHKPEYVTFEYHRLLGVFKNVSLTVTHEMTEQVEAQTRQQENLKLWFKGPLKWKIHLPFY